MLENLQDEVNRLFDLSMGTSPARSVGLFEGIWSPPIDLHESRDNFVVKADLPGLNKEDIEVYVQDNTLVIKGEKKQETDEKKEGLVRKERYYGSFHRAIALPAGVDSANVKAAYKNGVLELTLSKREEAKPKQIKVDVH